MTPRSLLAVATAAFGIVAVSASPCRPTTTTSLAVSTTALTESSTAAAESSTSTLVESSTTILETTTITLTESTTVAESSTTLAASSSITESSTILTESTTITEPATSTLVESSTTILETTTITLTESTTVAESSTTLTESTTITESATSTLAESSTTDPESSATSTTTAAASSTTAEQPPSCAETQVVADPSFEDNDGAWVGIANSAPGPPRTGSSSLEYTAIGNGWSTSFSQTLRSIDAGDYDFRLYYKSTGEPTDDDVLIYSCYISASIGGSVVADTHATGESTWDLAISNGYWSVPSPVSDAELKVEISCSGDYNRVFVYIDDVNLTRVCGVQGGN